LLLTHTEMEVNWRNALDSNAFGTASNGNEDC